MPQDATCTTCKHVFPVTESRTPFTVPCPKCEADLTVEFKKPATPPEAGQPPYELLVQAGSLPEAAPTATRRRRVEDDEEPRRKAGSGAVVFVSGGLGLLFVLVGLSLTGWFLFTQIDVEETASSSPARSGSNANGSGNRGVTPPPMPNPRPAPRPKERWPGGPTNPIGGEENPPIVRPPVVPPPKQPETPRAALELPPLPPAIPIKAAPVTKETSYKLPESIGSLRVGGGGRFLVLHFPSVRKFGLFDTSEAKVTRYIAAPEGEVHFAAGMTKLVVYSPGSGEVQRYDLLTGEREHSGKMEVPAGKVEAFCMGHASAGPLLVAVRDKGGMLFDIEKFQEIELPKTGLVVYSGRPGKPSLFGGYYWAGATGRIFGNTGNYGQPNGIRTVVLREDGLKTSYEHEGTWFVMPGPDDKYVYPGGFGVVSSRVGRVEDVPFSRGAGAGYASHLYLPAHHGPFYLHAMTIDDFGRGEKTPVGTVRLFMHGNKEPIATYSNTVVSKYGWEGLRGLGIEHSLHLIPKAKLLVIVPDGRDELRLYPADLEAALDKAGRDYVFVTSNPPARFEKGKALTYQLEARSRKGPVTFKLESGPKGMTVSDAGLLRWTAPADFAEPRADVIVLAKDATGQEVFHTFTLTAAAK